MDAYVPYISYMVSFVILFITIVVGFCYTQRQINAMRNIEKEKRIIAIQSLVLELGYNKQLVGQYIQHCKEGSHLDLSGKNLTWELVTPYFENYQYLTLACYSDMELANKITAIYSKLEGCKVIIKQILFFWANNIIIKESVINGRQLLQGEIVKYNSYLLNICNDVINLFDNIIHELNSIKDSLRN